jgi:TfoX/Sxy family transcriptional regulator of competence genes
MAFDPELADRVRGVLAGVDDVTEKKMFGGLTFMLGGKMCCGIVGDRLMVRVGPDAYDDALAEPFVATMDFTGRPLKGMVYVDGEGLRQDDSLAEWVGRGVEFASSL